MPQIFYTLPAKNMEKIFTKFNHIDLIERTDKPTPVLDKEFFDFLKIQLSMAMGPIAEVLIEDKIQEFGNITTKTPWYRAAELVDLLSRQIHREEKKIAFQQAMVNKINDLKMTGPRLKR